MDESRVIRALNSPPVGVVFRGTFQEGLVLWTSPVRTTRFLLSMKHRFDQTGRPAGWSTPEEHERGH
jgi:hypothetical protein